MAEIYYANRGVGKAPHYQINLNSCMGQHLCTARICVVHTNTYGFHFGFYDDNDKRAIENWWWASLIAQKTLGRIEFYSMTANGASPELLSIQATK